MPLDALLKALGERTKTKQKTPFRSSHLLLLKQVLRLLWASDHSRTSDSLQAFISHLSCPLYIPLKAKSKDQRRRHKNGRLGLDTYSDLLAREREPANTFCFPRPSVFPLKPSQSSLFSCNHPLLSVLV